MLVVAPACLGFASTPLSASPTARLANPCAGKKPNFPNANCFTEDGDPNVPEQAAADVTKGAISEANDMFANQTAGTPIMTSYSEAGLCPVNVHWHVGAEHRSAGQYDENGTAPSFSPNWSFGGSTYNGRRLAAGQTYRHGHKCHHYNASDPAYTTPYNWKYCDSTMEVGQTYEVHWPHSAAGMCSTPWQYQTPFYDGVFCNNGIISLSPLNTYSKIGVQAQVFTIINDENHKIGGLFYGAVDQGTMWSDVAYYTGSTTGTTRTNQVCSQYAPITWQVDRKCHVVSASSFDQMCKLMLEQNDDMTADVHAHGARQTVLHSLTADNLNNAAGR